MGAWGFGLFQSDSDLDAVSELGYEMGLSELEEQMKATAKASGKSDEEIDSIYLSIYGGSHAEVVREHLDSGVLASFVDVKWAKMMTIAEDSRDYVAEYRFCGSCYEYVLLGACAMSLGCRLPKSFLDTLKIVYTEFSNKLEALEQMRKALFGPGGFKNGEPYDFESKDLLETVNSTPDEPDDGSGSDMTNFPDGFFRTGGGAVTSTVIKELRDKFHNPDVCAGCSSRHGRQGGELLQCARCKDRKYCSSDCQKKHWAVHGKVCQPVDA